MPKSPSATKPEIPQVHDRPQARNAARITPAGRVNNSGQVAIASPQIVRRPKRPKRVSTNERRPRIAMVSTHGYVSVEPPLGALDTGGQVVYVIELSKTLAQLGYDVDIWTRRFDDLPEIDIVDEHVRIVREPSGGEGFIPK